MLPSESHTHIPAEIYSRRTPCPHLGRARIGRSEPSFPGNETRTSSSSASSAFSSRFRGGGTISKCPCATTHFLPYCPPTEASREAAGFVHHRARLADSELIPRYERLMARSTRVLIGWGRVVHSCADWPALRIAVNNDWLMVACPAADWLMVESS